MMRETLVFGPIHSRRLGSSLGINLLPERGKLCNFDCIYCECGWNADGLGDRRLPTAEELREALRAKLTACREAGTPIDSITFSGDGEPTLNPEFPEMVDITLALRDVFFPAAKVSILSNATRIGREAVFEALRKVDNPILKIDAATTELVRRINRPVGGGYDLDEVVANLRRFEGNFVLQTMFLRCPDFDSTAPENVEGWLRIVRELRPREVMVYTVDRETPLKGIAKVSPEEMAEIVRPLVEEGFKIQIRG
ncbi:MAG: radical SAM protein [Bacteroidales bacterium]|nr:radical SAM protein [Bacteroidales bacterium]